MSRYKLNRGYVALLHCKGIGRPQIAVRDHGRWFRVEPVMENSSLRNPPPPEGFEPLDYGLPRLNEYLDRKRIHYSDLPVFHA